jgi:hypothetical protein
MRNWPARPGSWQRDALGGLQDLAFSAGDDLLLLGRRRLGDGESRIQRDFAALHGGHQVRHASLHELAGSFD